MSANCRRSVTGHQTDDESADDRDEQYQQRPARRAGWIDECGCDFSVKGDVGGDADEPDEKLGDERGRPADNDREPGNEYCATSKALVIAGAFDVAGFGRSRFLFCAFDLGGEPSRYWKRAFLPRAMPKIRFQFSTLSISVG